MTSSEATTGVLPVLRPGARWGVRRTSAGQTGRPARVLGPVPQAGWYRVTGFGSQVRARALLTDEERREVLDALPACTGHHWSGRLVDDHGQVDYLHFAPADEDLEVGAPVVGRFWAPSIVAFDRVDMDDQPEMSVREAVLQGRAISAIPRVRASLRLAGALALVERASRAASVPFTPAEVGSHLREVAEGGAEVARRVIDALAAARAAVRPPAAPLPISQVPAAHPISARPVPSTSAPHQEPWIEGVARSLQRSGAAMLSARRAGSGRLEVVWSFRGGHYSSVLDDQTLNVLDAGVCLAGTDRRFTLDSLPSVIREGEERGLLVVTRHVPGAPSRYDDDYDD